MFITQSTKTFNVAEYELKYVLLYSKPFLCSKSVRIYYCYESTVNINKKNGDFQILTFFFKYCNQVKKKLFIETTKQLLHYYSIKHL